MGRTVRGGSRNHTPNVRPVQKVELSEKNTRQRFIAVIVLLVIASGAFMYALNGLMSNDSGWTNIEVVHPLKFIVAMIISSAIMLEQRA